MACAIIVNFQGEFFWNVDGNVGPGCPNKIDDVHLVQLGFYCTATDTKHPPKTGEKEAYSLVVPGAAYSGSASDPLTAAIKVAEKIRGGPQDGHISKMQPRGFYSPGHPWLIAVLNNHIASVLGNQWPFLDKHPKSTGQLKVLVKRTFFNRS